jgi:hypothetical protein
MSQKEEMTGLDRLRAHLATIQPGELVDTTDLEPLLAGSWDEFTGDYGGMEGYKLLGRIEDVMWQPPKLAFTIERHGGTVMGSTRAELQHWEVNVEQKTAVIVKCGQDQDRQAGEERQAGQAEAAQGLHGLPGVGPGADRARRGLPHRKEVHALGG